jgi:hypothetical protein
MRFHHEAIGSCGDRRERGVRDELAPTGRVARVGDDREMGQALQRRDATDVEAVARVRFEGSDPALAENDVAVALEQDGLGREKELLEGGRHAALEEDRAS